MFLLQLKSNLLKFVFSLSKKKSNNFIENKVNTFVNE